MHQNPAPAKNRGFHEKDAADYVHFENTQEFDNSSLRRENAF